MTDELEGQVEQLVQPLVIAAKKSVGEEYTRACFLVWGTVAHRAERRVDQLKGLGLRKRTKLLADLEAATLRAVDTYDPQRGAPFLAWLERPWKWAVRVAFKATRDVPVGSIPEGRPEFEPEDKETQISSQQEPAPGSEIEANEVVEQVKNLVTSLASPFSADRIADIWTNETGGEEIYPRRLLLQSLAHAKPSGVTTDFLAINELALYSKRRFWKIHENS